MDRPASNKSSPDAYRSGEPLSHLAGCSRSNKADTCRAWRHHASSCADAGFPHCRSWRCICGSAGRCPGGSATAAGDTAQWGLRAPLKREDKKNKWRGGSSGTPTAKLCQSGWLTAVQDDVVDHVVLVLGLVEAEGAAEVSLASSCRQLATGVVAHVTVLLHRLPKGGRGKKRLDCQWVCGRKKGN